jgi:hypothetical protein
VEPVLEVENVPITLIAIESKFAALQLLEDGLNDFREQEPREIEQLLSEHLKGEDSGQLESNCFL